MEQNIETLKQWVGEAKRMVFFGGAGVSTESGVPDFRSVDGLYSQTFAYPPEVMLSHSFYASHMAEFFDFYRAKLMPLDAKPNLVHTTLARWEQEGKLAAVVTQNIDGLHEKAGSKTVYNLHGTCYVNHCLRCGKFHSAQRVKDCTGVPLCECGGIIKPSVVLYEEGLDDATVAGACRAIERADLLIVGGTSLTVYPAAGFLQLYRGNRLVLLNRDPTPADSRADLVIHDTLGSIFAQLQ